MKSENPMIEWYKKSEKQYLKFTFKEMLTAQDADIAIEEWREKFQAKGNGPISLIWDCRRLKGYDSAARTKWTGALKEMKAQIETIWLISESSIVRMGASVMGMVTSLRIRTGLSESDIAS